MKGNRRAAEAAYLLPVIPCGDTESRGDEKQGYCYNVHLMRGKPIKKTILTFRKYQTYSVPK